MKVNTKVVFGIVDSYIKKLHNDGDDEDSDRLSTGDYDLTKIQKFKKTISAQTSS